ncbi:hypothetical protein OSB04_027643 [Centaurea solstitialis]|uniref:Uncharacterized protein n=1 Tax=Centaurea solstitialis TaxID=347529 RepID=A0AA38SXS4_9ASTR|nr:hypothetical protein OSB04_027643 [Centaurea solstitialis]
MFHFCTGTQHIIYQIFIRKVDIEKEGSCPAFELHFLHIESTLEKGQVKTEDLKDVGRLFTLKKVENFSEDCGRSLMSRDSQSKNVNVKCEKLERYVLSDLEFDRGERKLRGSKIHANILQKWIPKFKKLLHDGAVIFIKNPTIARHASKYKLKLEIMNVV